MEYIGAISALVAVLATLVKVSLTLGKAVNTIEVINEKQTRTEGRVEKLDETVDEIKLRLARKNI